MQTFRAKRTPLFLVGTACLLIGLFVTWDAFHAAASGSVWDSIHTTRQDYPIPLLLASGVLLVAVGAAAAVIAGGDDRLLTIGPAGIRQAPGMARPVSWDKISRIEQLKRARSRYIRKGWIIVTVPDRSDIERAGWMWHALAWSPGREGTIVIVPSAYENGDAIRQAIERYRPIE